MEESLASRRVCVRRSRTGGHGSAVRSHQFPERYPLHVVDDHYISLFAISGFACTLVGVLLFLYAIRNTTESMSGHLQTNVNIGVGLGFVLQLSGFFLPEILQLPFEISLGLILAGLPALVWGGMHYAQGKGYSRSFGLLAVLGILGLIVLILLPHRDRNRWPTKAHNKRLNRIGNYVSRCLCSLT